MTIIASGPGVICCGDVGVVQRVKGWRLPSALVPYVGRPYSEVPTPELERYRQWFTGPDRWFGHTFELWGIEDELDRRLEAGGEV